MTNVRVDVNNRHYEENEVRRGNPSSINAIKSKMGCLLKDIYILLLILKYNICMKKSIIVILFLSVATFKLITIAKDNDKQWEKINKYIYIDRSSITKNGDIVSGWFKIYDSPENRTIYEINNVPIYYKIIKYEASCNLDALFLKQVKLYNKNNNLLSDEINNYDVGADCSAFVDGKNICKALCKK